ncbi:MAG: CDP-alcohol phosphatidyltransferase family protein [Oscillospiraceae bacterium]|nr:CDP-alcohol phosphatidyltransferase family protein [Oscillospiraceae bacterium]
MFIKDWKKEIFTVPNLLSFFRLVMIPIYVGIYIRAESRTDYYIASGILSISCLTDLLDGWIARHYNMVSNVGKILDPFADKATQLSLLLCLVSKHTLLLYLLIIFVVKEGFQLIAGSISLLKAKKMLKGAQFTGKLCTTMLFATLLLMFMLPHISNTLLVTLFSLDIFFMLVAFADYLFIYCGHHSCFQSISDTKDLP